MWNTPVEVQFTSAGCLNYPCRTPNSPIQLCARFGDPGELSKRQLRFFKLTWEQIRSRTSLDEATRHSYTRDMAILGFDALNEVENDLIVVGTGPAGQASARCLADYGMRVLLLEQGNSENPLDAGGDDYSLDVTGLPYPASNTRLASFGGTSNLWCGQSHPLSPKVFDDRGTVRGWPITWQDYALDIPRAAAWLRLGDIRRELFGERDSNWWRSLTNLTTDQFRLSTPLVKLGEAAYLSQFGGHAHQFLVMDVRVTDIHLDAEQASVESIEVVHVPSRRTKRLRVKNVLFACGGIEVARLFLWASRDHPNGPLAGGPRQLTGKFFMDHAHILPMEVYFDSRVDISDTYWAPDNGSVSATIVRPTDEFLERNDLTRFGVFFWADGKNPSKSEAKALLNADTLFSYRAGPYFKTSPTFMFEQFPTEASYVTLSEKRDELGAPIARLHLQISDRDFTRFRRSIQLFGGLISQSGLARVYIREPYRDSGDASWEITWGYHHLGATRMASDVYHGVVDPDCRVFGLSNCYVVGGSIFPTTDYVNPTLSIVALAFRFANRFAARNIASMSRIVFGEKRQFNYLLKDGWARPEQKGIWTAAHRAEISIPGHLRKILFIGHAFAPPCHEPTIDLEVNGKLIFSGSTHGLFKRWFYVDEKSFTNVVFHIRNPVSPLQSGLSTDDRALGIFLEEIQLG
jgi:GMC oxidoreductase